MVCVTRHCSDIQLSRFVWIEDSHSVMSILKRHKKTALFLGQMLEGERLKQAGVGKSNEKGGTSHYILMKQFFFLWHNMH